MAGINRNDGTLLSGWPHTAQSIAVLLSTAFQSRIMRRDFGCDLPRLVDAPISPTTAIDFYAAAASAIAKFEPRYRVTKMGMTMPDIGKVALTFEGVYFPRGHLGDFSISEPRNGGVAL